MLPQDAGRPRSGHHLHRPSFVYPRPCSFPTSDEIARDGLYIWSHDRLWSRCRAGFVGSGAGGGELDSDDGAVGRSRWSDSELDWPWCLGIDHQSCPGRLTLTLPGLPGSVRSTAVPELNSRVVRAVRNSSAVEFGRLRAPGSARRWDARVASRGRVARCASSGQRRRGQHTDGRSAAGETEDAEPSPAGKGRPGRESGQYVRPVGERSAGNPAGGNPTGGSPTGGSRVVRPSKRQQRAQPECQVATAESPPEDLPRGPGRQCGADPWPSRHTGPQQRDDSKRYPAGSYHQRGAAGHVRRDHGANGTPHGYP